LTERTTFLIFNHLINSLKINHFSQNSAIVQIKKASSANVCLERLRLPKRRMIKNSKQSNVYAIMIAKATLDLTLKWRYVSLSIKVITSTSSIKKSKSIPYKKKLTKEPQESLNMIILSYPCKL